jgi:hypothetical protein
MERMLGSIYKEKGIMKTMPKSEFLRLFKKYTRIMDKSGELTLERIMENLKGKVAYQSCPFFNGYFYEVSKDGKVSAVSIDNPLSDKTFWEASEYFNANASKKLRKEMLDTLKTIKAKK